jgi:hypothetical protein
MNSWVTSNTNSNSHKPNSTNTQPAKQHRNDSSAMPPPTPRQAGFTTGASGSPHHMTPTNSQTSRRVPGGEVTPTQRSRGALATENQDADDTSDDDLPAPHTLIQKSQLAAQKQTARRKKQQQEPPSEGAEDAIEQDDEDDDETFKPSVPKLKTVAIRVSHRFDSSYMETFLTSAIDRFLERLQLKRLRT